MLQYNLNVTVALASNVTAKVLMFTEHDSTVLIY